MSIDEVKKVFSARLKALRDEIGISQEGFAKALGFARATLSYYESGIRTPDIYFLDTVHRKTGCSIEYLMGYSEHMRQSKDNSSIDNAFSDKAMRVLFDMPHMDILNFLIEHPRFAELIRIIKILSYNDFGDGGDFLDKTYREYKEFQAYKAILEISQSAYDDDRFDKTAKIMPGYDDMAHSVRKALDNELEEAFSYDHYDLAKFLEKANAYNGNLLPNKEISDDERIQIFFRRMLKLNTGSEKEE